MATLDGENIESSRLEVNLRLMTRYWNIPFLLILGALTISTILVISMSGDHPSLPTPSSLPNAPPQDRSKVSLTSPFQGPEVAMLPREEVNDTWVPRPGFSLELSPIVDDMLTEEGVAIADCEILFVWANYGGSGPVVVRFLTDEPVLSIRKNQMIRLTDSRFTTHKNYGISTKDYELKEGETRKLVIRTTHILFRRYWCLWLAGEAEG